MLTLAAPALLALQLPRCGLGLSLNVPTGAGAKELIAGIMESRRLGCDLTVTSVNWSELEPSPGQFWLDKLASDLGGNVGVGFSNYLLIKTINTSRREVPNDLAAEPWDSPRMAKREAAFLRAVARIFPAGKGHILLGNEVDGYLSGRPAEIEPYARFLEVGRSVIREVRPDLPVGVTTMFSGLAANRGLIERMHRNMDFVSMTYYPQRRDFTVLPTADVPSHFADMLRFAGTRGLFIQEAGYPASPLLGSSEAKQSEFVSNLFDMVAKYPNRLLGVCYFLSLDFSDAMVDGFTRYYGLGSDHFRAMLSTLGLKRQDGAPRMAWATFVRRATARQR
jgi:hypothetical protein